jgi:uncharacterized membrane protein (UPF0127 family)
MIPNGSLPSAPRLALVAWTDVRCRSSLPATCCALALGLLVPACSSASPQRALPTGTLRVATAAGQATLRVEVAADGYSRSKGLMDRRRLDPNAGMAFVFESPRTGGFWMKDTLIPLSIAFWDRSGRILKVLDMTPCKSDPCPVYYPGVVYSGAVEANLGWFASHGVRPGNRVVLSER